MTSATTPLALQPWTALVARRARRARARRVAKGFGRASPSTRCDALDDAVDAVGDALADASSRLPAALGERPYEVRMHTDTHVFPGLAQYDAIGAHFNVPAVLAATAVTTGVGVLLASQLWERSFRALVFPEEAAEERRRNAPPLTLCGVDCSAYPIFGDATVQRAVTFAARWHHGQYRRTGETYVTHCVESALILAAMLPTTAPGAAAKKKYVDAVAACVLHDVVDDTECELEDVRAAFGDTVATLVADVSTLGKLPQILRRSQRRRAENAAAAATETETGSSTSRLDADLERDAVREAGMTGRALKIAETRENFEGVDVLELASLRRMLWSLVRDPRCFLIKFADRIHNMRTAYAVDPTKAKFVANETLQVWCSFAEQLGMFGAKAEMEDLSFAVKDPESFRAVINARYDAWGVDGIEASRRRRKFAKRFETRKEEVRALEGYASRESASTAAALASEDETATLGGDEKAIVSGGVGDPTLRAKWTWEPPTGADVQMFFERIRRGENAGTPRDLRVSRADRKARAAAETARRVAEEARARALEEERLKRAKPTTPEQESLRALLACVPPFDVLRASNRSSTAAAAAAAATAAADAATAAAVAGAGADASARAYADARMGGASLDASLEALQKCRDTTLRSLQLDALAPGLRVDIEGRLKSAHSTHLKMRRKKVPFARVCDARALRVVVGEPGEQPGTREEVMACYDLVEAIHKLYRPVDGESDDYVANPKPSGYQSLHTAVVGPDGALLEFQVRTRAMHEAAEFGDAAHWLYKDFIAEIEKAGVEETDAVTAKTDDAAASRVSAAAGDASRSVSPVETGRPVLIVRGARGDRLAAGVVSWAEGSRMHVIEPARGDAFAPGLANAAGVVDVAEWVAMGLHASLLERAVAGGRIEPRQTGRGYAVIEFALCSDGRWHQRDAYGRVLGSTVADPLDVDALLDALEASSEKAKAGNALSEGAEASSASRSASTPGDEKAASDADDVVASPRKTLGAPEAPTRIELGEGDASVVADLASPDDAMVSLQVRAMQRALQAYLDDADDEAPDAPEGSGALRATAGSGRRAGVGANVASSAGDAAAAEDEKAFSDAFSNVDEEDAREDVSFDKKKGFVSGDGRKTPSVLGVDPTAFRETAAGGEAGAERAVEEARKELRLSLDALALDAAAEKRAKKRAAEAQALRSGEVESPIFPIARAAAAGAAPEADVGTRASPEGAPASGFFDAEDAAQMAEALSGRPTVTFDDENVLVVAWTKTDDGDETKAMTPELIKVPKGVTAAQVSRGVAGDRHEGATSGGDADDDGGASPDASASASSPGMNNSVPELVNVNMEMVPADTPLKQGDQVFLGDER